MSYPAQVFRLAIASPSDVEDECEIIVQAIQAWNDERSSELGAVVLPLRWKTHSTPEYGRRPQAIINQQIIDQSDFLVGVFWTRIGSPTGESDSGTLEEIERVDKQGKPVMIYFSNAKQEPDKIDTDQLAKLRILKGKLSNKALIESFKNQVELRDKFYRQLDSKIRELVSHDNKKGVSVGRPGSDIQLSFSDPTTGERKDQLTALSANILEVRDIENIPDYMPNKTGKNLLVPSLDLKNKEYYREMYEHLSRKSAYHPLRFWLKNEGAIGARDVYIELRFKASPARVNLTFGRNIFESVPMKSAVDYNFFGGNLRSNSPLTKIEKGDSDWTAHFEFGSIQPQRIISPVSGLAISARKNCTVHIEACIYADTLPRPVTKELKVTLKTKKTIVSADEFMSSLLQESRQETS